MLYAYHIVLYSNVIYRCHLLQMCVKLLQMCANILLWTYHTACGSARLGLPLVPGLTPGHGHSDGHRATAKQFEVSFQSCTEITMTNTIEIGRVQIRRMQIFVRAMRSYRPCCCSKV